MSLCIEFETSYIRLGVGLIWLTDISLCVWSRHLTNSVGQRASDEKNAARLPAPMFSMAVNCSYWVLWLKEQTTCWHWPYAMNKIPFSGKVNEQSCLKIQDNYRQHWQEARAWYPHRDHVDHLCRRSSERNQGSFCTDWGRFVVWFWLYLMVDQYKLTLSHLEKKRSQNARTKSRGFYRLCRWENPMLQLSSYLTNN